MAKKRGYGVAFWVEDGKAEGKLPPSATGKPDDFPKVLGLTAIMAFGDDAARILREAADSIKPRAT